MLEMTVSSMPKDESAVPIIKQLDTMSATLLRHVLLGRENLITELYGCNDPARYAAMSNLIYLTKQLGIGTSMFACVRNGEVEG